MNTNYRTKDLAESGALLVVGAKLLSIERAGKVCWFIFQNKEKCEDISNKFYFQELMINARDYYNALTNLKNKIFLN